MESRVGCRNSAIDGRLQQDLFDLLARDTVIEGSFNVHAKFIAPVQGDHHGKRQQAPSVARQAGTGPDFSPSVASNEVLKLAVEIGGRGNGSVYMFVAKNSTPNFHSLLIPFAVIHWGHQFFDLNPAISAAISSSQKVARSLCKRSCLLDIREVSSCQFNFIRSRNLITKKSSVRYRDNRIASAVNDERRRFDARDFLALI